MEPGRIGDSAGALWREHGHERDPCVSFAFESARGDVGPAMMMTGAGPKTYDMAVNKTHHDRRCRVNAALQALSRASHHA